MKAPRRWSLRTRLLAGVLTLVAAGFTVAGVASFHLLGDYLTDRIDEQLVAHARLGEVDLPESSEYVYELYDPQGNLIRRVTGPGHRGSPKLPVLDEPTVESLRGKPFYVKNTLGHDAGYRVLVTPRPDGQGSLVIAYDFTGIARTMARFVIIEFAVMLTVLVLAALLGVAVVRIGLRPLTEVEQAAEDIIAGGDLSRRVPVLAAPHTEIGRLSRTFNTMLDAIDGSVARLRRFVADASHELRTPVAGIRGLAELYRQGAVSGQGETAVLLARIEAEATRMGLLVEDLLLLARLDEERPLRREPVDLVPIAADAIEGQPVALDLFGRVDPVVLGDEDRLRQIMTNLVTNALTHTPPGTLIVMRVGVDGDQALVEVADHGPGIPAEHGDRVFERFYRLDPARARDHERSPSTGSGLGLSIVKALVVAHGGTVGHRPTPGGGATFWVRLPLTQA